MKPQDTKRCPCRKPGDDVGYDACCGPYHAGRAMPATAAILMRSRYTAFARGDAAYLQATWHPSTRPAQLVLTPGEQWIGLRIREAHEDGDTATVEFVARSRRDGRVSTLHEISRFRREHGRWLYVDGIIQ